MSAITIVLADDHQVVRQGLRALLQAEPGMVVVGEATTGQEALQLVSQLAPNVVVLDMVLPDLNGLAVLQQIKQRAPDTGVVVLSMYGDEAYVLRALQYDVDAYVLKESSADQLIQAIHEAMTGRHYLTPSLIEYVIKAYIQQARAHALKTTPCESLSLREWEVLQGIGSGRARGEIAAELSISPRTIDTYCNRLMRKLGLHSQVELVRYALHYTTLSNFK